VFMAIRRPTETFNATPGLTDTKLNKKNGRKTRNDASHGMAGVDCIPKGQGQTTDEVRDAARSFMWTTG